MAPKTASAALNKFFDLPPRREPTRAKAAPPPWIRTLESFKSTVRTADEFKGAATVARTAPRRDQPSTCWGLERIREARDAQLAGQFKLPVDLAQHMRTDDALYVAYHNRIAPQNAILRSLVPASGVRGKAIMKKAGVSIQTPGSVLTSIHGELADHGISIGYNEHVVTEGGTRVDFRLTNWPLEHVRYNSSTEQLETPTRNGPTVPIIHGDGRWTVFQKFAYEPWTQEAACLPGAFIWASHANGISDWNQATLAHGLAKLIGELPPGVPIGTAGALSADAAAFLKMLQDLVSGNSAAGIRPAGSKTQFESNASSAYQIFKDLAENREKAAARVYLGTDAILGSVGGAPGVDIAALFSVASSKLQGDFACIEAALRSGVYEPWTALNEGDSRYAPWLVYQLPDVDAMRRAEEQEQKRTYLFTAIKGYREAGMIVTQATVDMLSRDLGVSPAPQLAASAAPTTTLVLAPTQLSSIVRAGEARQRAAGLPLFGDERDNKTLTELDEEAKAKAAQKAAAANGAAAAALAPAEPAAP